LEPPECRACLQPHTTERAVVDKPAEEEDGAHRGHGHNRGHVHQSLL